MNTCATDDNAFPPADLSWLRGYTGHEHLDPFGLVNMNARLYDPKLGRILSVDNFVSSPGSAMGYNRYTYAHNNPLSYVDPSGNEPVILTAIAVGALISAMSYTAQAALSPGGLQQNFTVKGYLTSVAIGAASGAVSWGIGTAFTTAGQLTGAALAVREGTRMFAHGLMGAGFSGLQGGDMLSGFAAGFVSSAAGYGGAKIGGFFSTYVGGTLLSAGIGAASSAMTGGDPWMGAAIGAIGYATNQAMHKLLTVGSTAQALRHYFNGKGEPAMLDAKTQRALLKNKDFIRRHNNIVSGRTTRMQGNFSVDMTWDVFHVGRTNVDYQIYCNDGSCRVSYKLFANDGFWDVDFIDERFSHYLVPDNFRSPFGSSRVDGMGPGLERLNGHPYPYIPVQKSFTFPNPGY